MTSLLLRPLPVALALLLSSAGLALAGGNGVTEASSGPVTAVQDETPLFGGRVIVHIPSMPENMCYPIENSGVTRRMQYECHETLLLKDWNTTLWVPSVARAWHIEDMVVLKDDAPEVPGEVEVRVYRSQEDRELVPRRAVYGKANEAGTEVSPGSPMSDLPEEVSIPASSIDRVERGCVFTFKLRDDVKWQESRVYEGEDLAKTRGQMVDAEDVRFSWDIYNNPAVKCDEKRFNFEAIPGCKVLDKHTIRFFGASQSAFALDALADSMTLMASHIYNLSDPDCPDYSASATMAAQAEHINVNDHNKLWVGVGPYQVTTHDQQYVEAQRFVDEAGKPAYFDAANRPGYVDTIRWRYIPDDQAAMVAIENEELDFFARVKPEDYFGPRTNSDEFKKNFNKGYFYLGQYGFVCWNMHDPKLSDIVVRKAIAHSFDSQGYLANQYKGLGRQITGPVPFDSDGYPKDAPALAYDPDLALEMLEDAGWYDHDGNGIADKDGVELEIEFLYPSGNDASKILGRTLQDSVKPLGIKINLASLEWATFLQRMKQREFDSVNLAWIPPLESDPEQLWHSKLGKADALNTSNNAGVVDPEVDRLIVAIQREVDRDKRMELWKTFHQYIYNEVQPYLFGYNVPIKFAASKRIHGIEHSPIDPGYMIREWYFTDPSVPGTRPALTKM
ncbi:ABC transporter substrate-binding protein [Planctomycetes bacterium Poly30]|uniref:ABC transporter substrate-binding protein n=1 Tax=Saltatorellus ferox TaxID=2528018 RepID=UPI00119F5C96